METPQTLLGNLLQRSATTMLKNVSWCLGRTSRLSVCSCCLFILSVGTTGKSLAQSSLYAHFRGDTLIRSPWVLLTRLNSPSSLSLYLYEILQSFFVALCWNSFQYVHVSCSGGPRIDTALQVWLWQSWVETVFNCFISFEGNHSSWFQATNSNSESVYPCGSSGEGYLCLCCHWDR